MSHDQIVDAHRLSVETIERARRSSGAAIHLAQRDSNLAQIAPTSAEATHHGGASPFEMLMTRTPHIADRVHHIAREGQSHGHRASIADLHRLWLRDLRRDGVGDDEYPFTTRSCGRSAFSRWLRQIQGPEGEGRS